jgi:hypothetical protein
MTQKHTFQFFDYDVVVEPYPTHDGYHGQTRYNAYAIQSRFSHHLDDLLYLDNDDDRDEWLRNNGYGTRIDEDFGPRLDTGHPYDNAPIILNLDEDVENREIEEWEKCSEYAIIYHICRQINYWVNDDK